MDREVETIIGINLTSSDDFRFPGQSTRWRQKSIDAQVSLLFEI